MKKVFISINFNKKNNFANEIKVISNILIENHISPCVFVNEHSFLPTEEKKMMTRAMEEIATSEFLIAEVSEKAIGIGIEIGYAKGLKKKVIYLRNHNTEHSTTVGGVADSTIIYNNSNDLKNKLSKLLKTLL